MFGLKQETAVGDIHLAAMANWRDWYGSATGGLVHPNAPTGGLGPGSSSTRLMDWQWNPLWPVPHPNTPHGRMISSAELTLADLKERAQALYDAICLADDCFLDALIKETGIPSVYEVLSSIFRSLLIAVAMVVVVGLIGAFAGAVVGGLIGALAGGVGAIPGAAAGAAASGTRAALWALQWLGLGFLIVHIASNLYQVDQCLTNAVERAWNAPANRHGMAQIEIHAAAQELARAIAILARLILEAIVGYLLARGGAKAVEELSARLAASRLGARFATWVKTHVDELLANPKLRPMPTASPHRVKSDGAPAVAPTQLKKLQEQNAPAAVSFPSCLSRFNASKRIAVPNSLRRRYKTGSRITA